MDTLDDFAIKNPGLKPADTLRRYSQHTKLELLKSGWDQQLADDIDQELLSFGAENMEENDSAMLARDLNIKIPGAAPVPLREEEDDLRLTTQVMQEQDPALADAARSYLVAQSEETRSRFDDPKGYEDNLAMHKKSYDDLITPETRNKVKRDAMKSGDLPFAMVDGSLEMSKDMVKFAGNDAALAAHFEANPNLDRSMIPEIKRKLSTPEGFTSSLASIERQHDFLQSVSAIAGKDPHLAGKFSQLNSAVNEGAEGNLDPLLGQIDSDLRAYGIHSEYSPEERKAFLKDALQFSAATPGDHVNMDANVRQTSTGQAVIPMSVMLDKGLFDKTLAGSTRIPEAQKQMLQETRDAQVASYAPEAFRIIAAHDDDFNSFLQKNRAQGKNNQAILDSWVASDPENYGNLQTAMGYVANKPKFDVSDTVIGIWDSLKGLGTYAPAAFYQMTEGMERPDKYSPSAAAAFKEAEDLQKEMDAKTSYRQSVGLSSSTGETFREIGPSLGGSLATLAATIPAAVAGAEAGGAIGGLAGVPFAGVGAAPGAVVGGLVGGAIAGGAVGGTAAYRMAGAQFLNQAFTELEAASMKTNGRPMNEEEKASQYEVLLPIAQNTGAWEAGPEAIANLVTLGSGKILLGVGKSLARSLTETGLKEAGKYAATKVGGNVIKAGALLGNTLTEMGTEALTNVEQSADQQKMNAIVAGGDPSKIKADWSIGGFNKSLAEVAPQTLALTSLMGVAGLAGGKVTGAMKEAASQRNKRDLFGENLAMNYDVSRIAAPVAADVRESLLLGGSVQENPSLRNGVKRALSASLSDETRAAVLAPGENAEITPMLRAVASEVAAQFSGDASQVSRAVSSTYAQMSSMLHDTDGEYTAQQIHEISTNHAMIAGLNSSVVTGSFPFLGATGGARLANGVNKEQLSAIFNQASERLSPSVTAGLDMGSPSGMVASAMGRTVEKMGVTGSDLIDYVDRVRQTIDNSKGPIDLVQASKEALYSGMLGVSNEAKADVAPSPNSEKVSLLRRTASNLRKNNASRTAEALERFAQQLTNEQQNTQSQVSVPPVPGYVMGADPQSEGDAPPAGVEGTSPVQEAGLQLQAPTRGAVSGAATGTLPGDGQPLFSDGSSEMLRETGGATGERAIAAINAESPAAINAESPIAINAESPAAINAESKLLSPRSFNAEALTQLKQGLEKTTVSVSQTALDSGKKKTTKHKASKLIEKIKSEKSGYEALLRCLEGK